jgi:hypothetical protein
LEGVNGNIEIFVQKCAECHLEIGFGHDAGKIPMEQVEGRVYRKQVNVKEGHFLIKVVTNNYAFYSIVVQREGTPSAVSLEKTKL